MYKDNLGIEDEFENMPSHPRDFSRELDGYRFLNA